MGEKAVSTWRVARSEFVLVSERIMRIHLKFHTGCTSVIAVYVPTNEPMSEPVNEKGTVEFFEALQGCVRQVPEQDSLIIMGDFSARVGNDVAAWQGTLGRFRPAEHKRMA